MGKPFVVAAPLTALLALLLVAAAIVLLTPHAGRAAFPGANGDIAFDSDRFGDEQIFRISSSGGDAVQLTTLGRNFSPAWSPDGSRIAFVSERDLNAEIYVMNADGSAETRLTTNPTQDSAPAWSADGNEIVFLRRSPTINDIAIWTVAAAGGDPVVLIDSPGTDTMPAFSPDGSKIAYGHNDPGEDLEIYVADADGSNPTPLTNNATLDRDPNWSPDGTRIVYGCPPDSGDSEICVVDADGGNQQTLTANTDTDRDPSWSPDGTRIAFESDRPDGSISGIYTMNPAGSDVQPVSMDGDYEPDWQPLSASSPTPTPRV
jgi:Tol biopolymer transport system component